MRCGSACTGRSVTRRVVDVAVGGPGSSGGGIGCARLVGPALIAQHAGAGDLGGAGDRPIATRAVDGGLPPE